MEMPFGNQPSGPWYVSAGVVHAWVGQPTSRHPQHQTPQKSSQLQHCDDQLTLLSPHHISFPIQRGRLFAMASRQFTVDSAKKREFINIFLLMPESSVINSMRQAEFTEKDIADLPLRRSLQHALPGRSIKGLKGYIARQPSKQPPFGNQPSGPWYVSAIK